MLRGMLKRFGRAPNAARAPEAPPDTRPRPASVVYAVGDLHGRSDLLEAMLAEIDRDIGATGVAEPMLVFVGDYIDRGHASSEVLTRLQTLNREMPDNVICLMGNHERMMLDFLDNPAGRGARWLRNGGLETLRGFNLHDGGERLSRPLGDLATALRRVLPSGQELWLRDLPTAWTSGNIAVVHAGADPVRPIDAQSDRVLLWGHPAFTSEARRDGVWVVHGHLVTATPGLIGGRIAIDTGACRTGLLTAAKLTPDGDVELLQASR